jgi:tripeptidyl-peptidase-1
MTSVLLWGTVTAAAHLADAGWVKMDVQYGPKELWRSTGELLGERGQADPVHKLMFAVKPNGMRAVEETLEAVSDPGSPRYGQYLTFDEVGRMIENRNATDNVLQWLRDSAVTATATPYGEYVHASAATSVWNRLLNTQFRRYENVADDSDHVVRAPAYSLPEGVRANLDCVLLATDLPATAAPKHRRPMEASVGGSQDKPYVYPSVLSTLYGVGSNSANGHGSQSVFETAGQNYSPRDLTQFQKNYSLPVTPIAHNIGGQNDSETCVIQSYKCSEANLDTQQITAMAQDLPTWFWSVEKVTFAAWLADVASTADAPLVHSISYGQYESETGPAEFTQFNNAAMKLGLQVLYQPSLPTDRPHPFY